MTKSPEHGKLKEELLPCSNSMTLELVVLVKVFVNGKNEALCTQDFESRTA